MDYQYGTSIKGMYIDRHERDDVVEYWQSHFIPLWSRIRFQMMTWSSQNPDKSTPLLSDFLVKKQIVLLIHDELTFYCNDCHKYQWIHKSETAVPA